MTFGLRFSFGSGEWRNGAEAQELTQDAEGRWFSFSVTLSTVVVMERKGMATHLASLPCIETPSTLETVLRELEDAGEVKLGVSHHTLTDARDGVSLDKTLVFALDALKDDDEKKKKKEEGQVYVDQHQLWLCAEHQFFQEL
ncbi:unnamed protein product [Durusdinium trenchii]|uniref:Uncharacterized protein n=1 Tax=Durusdinium trenchii TaxID=1381693 RepID=A0ABP0RUT6_9DINO